VPSNNCWSLLLIVVLAAAALDRTLTSLLQKQPSSCVESAARALGVAAADGDFSCDDGHLARTIRRVISAAADSPSCRAHASFSGSLWRIEGHNTAAAAALNPPPPQFSPCQLAKLQSASSLLFADARARDAAASLRLRLILSSCRHVMTPLPMPQTQSLLPPLSSSDAVIRAFSITKLQLQQALRAVAPPLPQATSRNENRTSGSSSASAASCVRSHIIAAVPDRGGRPNDLNHKTVARDVSSANAALKGQVARHDHAKGAQLPAKRRFQGGGKSSGQR
jgi:hypothetical protein